MLSLVGSGEIILQCPHCFQFSSWLSIRDWNVLTRRICAFVNNQNSYRAV